MSSILFEPEQIRVQAEINKSILDICFENDILIGHKCGGVCSCTTCVIYIKKGAEFLNIPDEEEREQLKYCNSKTENQRLACMTKLRQIPEDEIIIEVSEYFEETD